MLLRAARFYGRKDLVAAESHLLIVQDHVAELLRLVRKELA
jgi:hypothetical protein